jgi:flagellar motility protein MotE (MotC chaperone)
VASSTASSVFISRVRGLPVLDAAADQVGRVRDVVVLRRTEGRAPRVKGLVVELFARRRIFIPMERVRSVDPSQVVIGGVVNTRRFERRESETLVIDDLFDLVVQRHDHSGSAVIFDVAMKPVRSREWELSEIALRDQASPMRFGVQRFGRPGHVVIVDWHEVALFTSEQIRTTDQLIAQMEDMKPADVARELHDMSPERRTEVASALDDSKLADALEELPEDEQVQLISELDTERAADILEEMDPDDAADLIAELTPEMAEVLLARMEPDEARDVRRLLNYAEFTAGGMMTPEPVILPPDATVADALAMVRDAELTPALACMVYVCRPPLETPTGRFVGGVHIQRLLREPPSTLVSGLIDTELEPLQDSANLHAVSRYFATYNLVNAPVIDAQHRLIGAVTVDDVLDHVLPPDWRGTQLDAMSSQSADRDLPRLSGGVGRG